MDMHGLAACGEKGGGAILPYTQNMLDKVNFEKEKYGDYMMRGQG